MRALITLVLFSVSPGLLSQDLSEGLLAHYPFSGDANDLSDYENHGVIIGAELTEDRFGNPNSAYLFNGMDTYISIPSSESLESPDSAITLSAWVYLTGWSLVGQPFNPILMKSDSPSNNFMYRMSIDATGVGVALNSWTNNIYFGSVTELNEWNHFAASLCSTSAKFYVNNVLISEESFICDMTPSSLPLEIGRDVPGILEVFNGAIDDVRIYNRCVSEQEVDLLFEDSPSTLESFDEAGFSLSPNPSASTVIIRASQTELLQHIQLIDGLGRIVREERFSPTNAHVLDLSGMKKGLYRIVVLDEQSIASTSLMVN